MLRLDGEHTSIRSYWSSHAMIVDDHLTLRLVSPSKVPSEIHVATAPVVGSLTGIRSIRGAPASPMCSERQRQELAHAVRSSCRSRRQLG